MKGVIQVLVSLEEADAAREAFGCMAGGAWQGMHGRGAWQAIKVAFADNGFGVN